MKGFVSMPRIMGLDVGSKTIGVAVSDELGWTAQGVKTIYRKSLDADMVELDRLIAEYQIGEILIGLPLNMNGTAGPSAEMAQALGAERAARYDIKITYRDERCSTMAATRILLDGDLSRKKRKKVIDKMAAVFVLQGYLDYLQNNK